MKIIDHIKFLKQRYNLKLTMLQGLQHNWLGGAFCYEAEMVWNGHKVVAHGTHELEKFALIKAMAELTERVTLIQHQLPHSNGLAAHTSINGAQHHAYLESIERDAFFCHWLTRQSAMRIGPGKNVKKILEQSRIRLSGTQFHFFKLRSLCGHVVLCCITGEGAQRPFGVIIGLGCSEYIEDAMQKSVYECVPNLAIWMTDDQLTPLSQRDFDALLHPKPLDHLRLGLGNSAQFLMTWLDSKNPEPYTLENLEKEEEKSLFVTLSTPKEMASPFVVSRCVSGDMQPLFFGNTQTKYINMNRMRFFSNNPSNTIYNYDTHFVG